MNHLWQNIHRAFSLNSNPCSKEELKEVAYSLVKEGKDFEKHIGDFLLDWCSDKAMVDVFTSGSTGTPKKITLKKSQMVNSALATGKFFNLQSGSKVLLCLPSTTIAGKMMLVRAMVLGLELDYVEPSSNPLTELQKTYDFCAMVPFQALRSFDNLGKVKTLVLGGAPINPSLETDLRKTKIQIFETYGMTETITHIALRRISPDTEKNFQLLPNIRISKDERGCLVLDAPSISDDKVITNDLVEVVSETSFSWLGRHDSIINSGGIKLIPEQMEKKLSVILLERFFITSKADKELGEKVVLIIEGQGKPEEVLLKIKRSKLLSTYEIPKSVIFSPKFHETSNGKVQRKKTMKMVLG